MLSSNAINDKTQVIIPQNINSKEIGVAQQKMGSVVDLFCGAGGLTHGLFLEGFSVAAGVDIEEDCRYAFEQNNRAPFIRSDVSEMNSSDLQDLFHSNMPRILVGCAPCQPFSTYNQKNDDPKWQLVQRFAELIVDVKPDIVSMENVPRLLDFQDGQVFASFLQALEGAGYTVTHQLIFLPDYGLPQRRTRLVVLASRFGELQLIPPTHKPANYSTVRDTIGNLPALSAGDIDVNDPLHTASRLSPLNTLRIKSSKPGGSWREWDESLVAACHRKKEGKGYRSVYGRMRDDEPAPTITTQFYGFGNGRFGHPTQDRALSLREGALLQSFPADYKFVKPGNAVQFKKLGKMIGNAVPVTLGRVIARSIKAHMESHHV